LQDPASGGVYPRRDRATAATPRQDALRVEEALQQGLASPENKAFVEKLRQP
jgi:hypothetical protein